LAWVLPVVVLALFSVCLAGCGGSGGASGVVVAEVGGSAITRGAVNHWMATLAGGDYYELSGRHTVPAGLVSDPPDYAGCVARLEGAAAGSPTRGSKLTGPALLTKCQQLYLALRLQAAAFLVRAQLVIGMAREMGIVVSDGEVLQLQKRSIKSFPNEAEYLRDLASRKESVSDELLNLKLNLLSQKITQKFGAEFGSKVTEGEQRWNAKTSCTAGYIVEHCKQFTGRYPSSSDAAVLMEQVAKLATGRCINLPACGKNE
jgi:hypothetical protein